MIQHWNALLLLIDATLSTIRTQFIDWRGSIRWPLRFVAMLVCGSVAWMTNDLFQRLPHGWPGILLDNIGDPRAIVAALCLLVIAAVGGVYGVAAAKLERSL